MKGTATSDTNQIKLVARMKSAIRHNIPAALVTRAEDENLNSRHARGESSPAKKIVFAKKALAKTLKANRDFYQSVAIWYGAISSLILGATVQVLMGLKDAAGISFMDDSYSKFGSYGSELYAASAFEGISLFFGFLLMLMPREDAEDAHKEVEDENFISFSKSVRHIWPMVFVMMVLHSIGGIGCVLILLTKKRNPKAYTFSLLVPVVIFAFMVSYLAYMKLKFDWRRTVQHPVSLVPDQNGAQLTDVKVESIESNRVEINSRL